jgi:hypothetical protein
LFAYDSNEQDEDESVDDSAELGSMLGKRKRDEEEDESQSGQ